MNTFRYRATDESGQPLVGTVQAETWEDAHYHLSERGLRSIVENTSESQTWTLREEFKYVAQHLDRAKLLWVLRRVALFLAIFITVMVVTGRKTLQVEGTYRVAGKPDRLEVNFFVDGKRLVPRRGSIKFTRGRYRCALVFYQWSRPKTIRARLRMLGYSVATHQVISLRRYGKRQVVQLPPLNLFPLAKQGSNPARRNSP